MGTPKHLQQTEKYSFANISRWLLPVAICFLELLFHIWVGGSLTLTVVLTLLGFALALGGLLNLLAAVLPPKGCK